MGGQLVQGSFPNLKDQILFSNDMVDCNVFLHITPLILGFRTKYGGFNQIRSAFYSEYDLQGENVTDVFILINF
jgi:hypothetical protein